MAAGFEVRAAWVMGVVLPLLETLRRGTDFSNFHSYVDDWIAGALLLLAARAVSQGRPNGRAFLAAAWGVLCGGLYGSFFWQLTDTDGDPSGLPNLVVVGVKGALYAVAVVALVLSIRRAGVVAQGGSPAR